MPALAWCSLRLDPNGKNIVKTVAFSKILQAVSMMDLAVITVRGEDASLPEFVTGTPAHIKYGWNPEQIEDFYGYVNHITPPYERTEFNATNYYMDVVCVSASYIYRQALQKIWQTAQVSGVVAELADSGRFSSLVETDDPAWPQLSCAGQSQWEFLSELANKLGWVLACNKTNFRCLSIDRTMRRSVASMPTFYTKAAAPTQGYETINNFQSIIGETVPEDGHIRANRVMSNVDLRTGSIFTVQNNEETVDSTMIGSSGRAPFFTKYEQGLTAIDSVTAQARLDAEAQRNRWHIQATATVTGDTTVVQGVPVVLLGLGTQDSGVWFVQEVVHRFRYGVYMLDLKLGRDSSGDSGVRSSRPSYIAWTQSDPISTLPASTPSTILVANQWRASFGQTTKV